MSHWPLLLVPGTGVEPARILLHSDLNAACLPISPPRQGDLYIRKRLPAFCLYRFGGTCPPTLTSLFHSLAPHPVGMHQPAHGCAALVSIWKSQFSNAFKAEGRKPKAVSIKPIPRSEDRRPQCCSSGHSDLMRYPFQMQAQQVKTLQEPVVPGYAQPPIRHPAERRKPVSGLSP